MARACRWTPPPAIVQLCRRSFATHLFEGGWSVTDLMTQLGHSHLETTQIYAASISGRRRATVLAMDFGSAPAEPTPESSRT